MSESGNIELVEDRIPLSGIRETAVDLIRVYGGELASEADREISFALPARRGAPTGAIDCRMSWEAGATGEGTVTLTASRESERPRAQTIGILIIGVLGAILWMLWPFFPSLGPAAWLGGVLAFASYFLTLRRTSGGLAADFLQRVARTQRAK